MAKIKKKIVTTPNASKDEEKLDPSYIAGRNVKWHIAILEKSGSFL